MVLSGADLIGELASAGVELRVLFVMDGAPAPGKQFGGLGGRAKLADVRRQRKPCTLHGRRGTASASVCRASPCPALTPARPDLRSPQTSVHSGWCMCRGR